MSSRFINRQWWSIFGVGVVLGVVVFGMRLLLTDEPILAGAGAGLGAEPGIQHRMKPPTMTASGADEGETGLLCGPNRLGSDCSTVKRPPYALPLLQADAAGSAEAPSRSGDEKGDRQQHSEAGAGSQRKTDAGPSDPKGSAASGDKGGRAAAPSEQRVSDGPSQSLLDDVQVRVYLTKERKVERVPLESYVLGVLAGEMPADFEIEALKAQAVAARTYIVRRLASAADSEMERQGADVSDTVEHQVYVPKHELAQRWSGKNGEAAAAKLKLAVEETRGLIITYEGEPIEAAFFSTSNGYTENSEDYWELALPYLRSVDSPWDKELSPRYEQKETFGKTDFYRAMGLSGKAAGSKLSMKVTERTEGNRIKSISINGHTFTGREVREKLGLASSQFTWKIEKDQITFTTYGLGHGVGMSQWGANGMAKQGKSAEEIVRHYYTGAQVEQASKLPARAPS